MCNIMIRPNLLKIVFLIVIIVISTINLNANEAEKERLNSWIKARKEILAELDSLIAKGIPIDFDKMELESRAHTMDGGIRQIEFYYKFMTNGTKLTQKLGIDGVSKWWYNTEGGLDPRTIEWYKMAGQYTVTDADSSYFKKYKPIITKKLYEILDDEYPALQVTAARTLAYMGISDSLVIDKLEYYANGTNSNQWNIENTGYPDKSSTYWEGKTENERRNDCVRVIVNIGKTGLLILRDRINKSNSIIESKDNEKEINELNLNIRDLDWDGQASADYCNQWWGGLDPLNPIWNPDYSSYPADCCNFASQCLIAGYYEDITFSSYANDEGCITWCPSLHDYLSNRFDVVTTVVDFHTNGWEIGDEPNNHIPANFTVGDIAIVGFHEEGTGPNQGHYKHAIICHGYEGNGYELFGAHTTNNIEKTMAYFIDSGDAAWDYATFYHITNNWNCNTQIAGGAVSGTWTHANSPYCINGEITILNGSQLTIEPGVDVIFNGHYKFNIYGRLVAEGDWQRYINFTAQNHTTGWNGLRFFDQNSNGQVDSEVVYCKLQYGNASGAYPDCNGGAIYLENSDILIDNCIISNNSATGGGGGVFLYNSSSPTINNSLISNNSASDTGGAIHIWNEDYNMCFPVFNGLSIINNTATNEGGGIYCEYWSHPVITNSTFYGNSASSGGGIYSQYNQNYQNCPAFNNCILWNDTPDEIFASNITVNYSDIQGGSPGDGNINTDPLFADPSNEDLHLTEPSLCIDSGHPESPLDPDNTVADMGAFYFHHDYDIHHFTSGWHWESFPRIGIESNNNDLTNIVPILDAINPDFTELYMRYNSDLPDDYVLVFEENEWSPTSYNAQSSWLYKIEILPEQERILTVDGGRLPEDFDLSEEDPLESGTYHWLSYWLPRSQNIVDAFGFGTQDDDFWQYVEKVKSEDWYYNKCSIIRVGDPSVTVSWSTENKTLEYGKGYMVWFKDTPPITNFHWTDSEASEEPEERGKSEYFTYEEKSDYEVVDVVSIPENVAEIGVFEDDQCVGAVVVQDSCSQILVYSNNINRDPIPFDFEIVTGRGLSIPIKNYKVLNWFTGEFEQEIIISGMQEYSIIMLGEEGEQEDNVPSITQLHSNYPNPFNPSTSISFSIPEEAKVSLKIFNIKGQRVKTLYTGFAEAGKHTMTWNGEDENNKPVASGIYFYKLKSSEFEKVKKMLLLK